MSSLAISRAFGRCHTHRCAAASIAVNPRHGEQFARPTLAANSSRIASTSPRSRLSASANARTRSLTPPGPDSPRPRLLRPRLLHPRLLRRRFQRPSRHKPRLPRHRQLRLHQLGRRVRRAHRHERLLCRFPKPLDTHKTPSVPLRPVSASSGTKKVKIIKQPTGGTFPFRGHVGRLVGRWETAPDIFSSQKILAPGRPRAWLGLAGFRVVKGDYASPATGWYVGSFGSRK